MSFYFAHDGTILRVDVNYRLDGHVTVVADHRVVYEGRNIEVAERWCGYFRNRWTWEEIKRHERLLGENKMNSGMTVEEQLKQLAQRFVDANTERASLDKEHAQIQSKLEKSNTLLANIRDELKKHVGPNAPRLMILVNDDTAVCVDTNQGVYVQKVIK